MTTMKTHVLFLAGCLATTPVAWGQNDAAPAANTKATPVAADTPPATNTTAAVTAPATNTPAKADVIEGVKAGANEKVPLIVIDDVPLLDAVKNLARQAGLNYLP